MKHAVKLTAIYSLCCAVGLVLMAAAFGGCYPKVCAPKDTSCWPCPQPGSTNPACVPPLHDERPPR